MSDHVIQKIMETELQIRLAEKVKSALETSIIKELRKMIRQLNELYVLIESRTTY